MEAAGWEAYSWQRGLFLEWTIFTGRKDSLAEMIRTVRVANARERSGFLAENTPCWRIFFPAWTNQLGMEKFLGKESISQ